MPINLEELVRRFPENGMKLLLENPRNVRDLLSIAETDLVNLIDLDHLQRLQTTFVQRDYRHVESDVVLTAPLKKRKGAKKKLIIYILIEHQSEPDRLMPFRMLEYEVEIFRYQVREWSQTHSSFAHIQLQPVLPVVFYTGTHRWEHLGSMVELIEMGERFRAVTPVMEPLFINLPATDPETLQSEGGFFGSVLRLVQQRTRPLTQFRAALQEVVQHLETMPGRERLRWLELLSYIHALVYHERDPSERPGLQQTVETSVATDEHRQEIFEMKRTIAQEMEEEGAVKALRRALIRNLNNRFGDVDEDIVSIIQNTSEVEQLESWLDRVWTAKSLKSMGIR